MDVKRCGIYLRVSTERQAEVKDGSLDAQEKTLKDFIRNPSRSEKWILHKVYREEGRSGKDTNRPEFQRMLEDVKNGEINVILCTKLDRISRSLIDFYKMHKVFDDNGVAVVTLDGTINTSNPQENAMLKIKLVFAELERELTSERTSAQYRHRASQGIWCGGHPPLGYDFDPNEKGHLIVNKDEAPIVKLTFETYIKEASMMAVARILNEKGFRTKSYVTKKGKLRGGKEFDNNAIFWILHNVVYIGKINLKGELFQGNHNPLIQPKTFNKVQDIIKQNSNRNRSIRIKGKYNYLLKGKVRCFECGSMYTTTHSTKKNGVRYFYYKCSKTNHNGKNACPAKSISAMQLDRLVVKELKRVYEDAALIKNQIKETNASGNQELKQLQGERNALLEQKKRSETKKDTIIEKIINQNIESEIIKEELSRLDENRLQIIEELEIIENRMREIRESHVEYEDVKKTLKSFSETFDELNDDGKVDAVQSIVHSVSVREDLITIWCYMHKGAAKRIRKSKDSLFDEHIGKLPGSDSNQQPCG